MQKMNVKLIGLIASVILAGCAAARAEIISNLEVHYQFENPDNFGENSAGVDATAIGGLSPQAGPGTLGQAADFGTYQDPRYLEVNGKSDPADGPLSMAAWFKTTDGDNGLTVIHGAGDASDDVAVLAIVLGRPAVLLGEAGSDPSTNPLVHSSELADGQWHHMAMTWSGGSDDTLRLFVDGRLSDFRTQSAGTLNISGWNVGKKYGGADYFSGSMDDVRMYSRALDDGGVSTVGQLAGGDIAELYALGVPEPGTLLLLISAGTALLFWRRCRRRVGR